MPLNLPGTWPEMQKEMDHYRWEEQLDRDLVSLYQDIFAVWYRYFDRICYSVASGQEKEEELKDHFRRGRARFPSPRVVLLELENLFSLQLDCLARREGYRPGEDLALLS